MTPMELQYLVGLCCLRRSPDDVEIILGDMVPDVAAEKPRDVDVTVKITERDGTIRVFQGLEVKHESKPLDVTVVEQLTAKLLDMPSVTHRAIVSSSGFTDGAKKKASRHGIELYEFGPWTGAVQNTIPHWKTKSSPREALRGTRWLLYWTGDARLELVATNAPPKFVVDADAPILDAKRAPHSSHTTFASYRSSILTRSTQMLWCMEPAVSLLRTPSIEIDTESKSCRTLFLPHSHTLDVLSDSAHLLLDNKLSQISHLTILGHLYWESPYEQPDYRVLRRVHDQEVFASAMVTTGRIPGEMCCFVFDPTSPVSGVHFVELTERQQKILKRFRL